MNVFLIVVVVVASGFVAGRLLARVIYENED